MLDAVFPCDDYFSRKLHLLHIIFDSILAITYFLCIFHVQIIANFASGSNKNAILMIHACTEVKLNHETIKGSGGKV